MQRLNTISRREFIRAAGTSLFLAGLRLSLPLPAWALSAAKGIEKAPARSRYELAVEYAPFQLDGRDGTATAVNGMVPGPLVRWREGEEIIMRVTNRLMDSEHASIHWHGILVPHQMDGVPGLSFDGIQPGQTYEYRFRVRQAGTYWYHSHSRFQEQTGAYGPLVIDPQAGEPFAYDRDYLIVLSDWSFEDPETIYRHINLMSDYYNFQRPTLGELIGDLRAHGWRDTMTERLGWARMRMSPVDLADVTGHTYSFLLNGHSPDMNWTARFNPHETLRLRFINASSMTNFDVRIPGLDMEVVMADGKAVQPVAVHEFRMGVAETYDVLVRPPQDRAFTIFAESLDRSGFARGTLAPASGPAAAAVPGLRPRPMRRLADLGMDHGSMGHGGDHGTGPQTPAENPDNGPSHDHDMQNEDLFQDNEDLFEGPPSPEKDQAQPPPAGDHRAHDPHARPMTHELTHAARRPPDLDARIPGSGPAPFTPPDRSSVEMVSMNPKYRLDELGVGLGNDGWRVLSYQDLVSIEPQPYSETIDREMTIHITANMERYMFSFDGKKFSEHEGPYRFRHNERLRLYLVNHTMMEHPIHLHGMWMQLENGADRPPFKHTVLIKPDEVMSLLITPVEKGDWGFHCHLLYHMEAGMFQFMRVT